MEIGFECPHCRQHLSVDKSKIGQTIKCSSCGKGIALRAKKKPPRPLPQANDEMIFCPKCGQKNLENSFKCTRCGFELHSPSQPRQAVTDEKTLGGLIPYKNAQALWAYYLGIFSLIPCLGIPLGIAAFILGIKGLKYAELHIEARGKGHAWAGIVLGALCAIGYGVMVVAFITGALN